MPNNKIVSADGTVCLMGGANVSQLTLGHISSFVDRYIAVDGGADHALKAGIKPVAVIGDLDSLSQTARATFDDVLCHISEQDSTDFEKALSGVDARAFIAVGFTGGRIDHVLAVLNVMARYAQKRVFLVDDDDVSFIAAQGQTRLDLPGGCRVAIMSLGDARVSASGVQWPFADQLMQPTGFISSSNAAVGGPITIDVRGPVLITLPQTHLAHALQAGVRG